jgi:hypothetical protein
MGESAFVARPGRCEIRGDLKVGRRSVNWWLGRIVVDEHELVVRSLLPWWIPDRSASRQAAGDISVSSIVYVHLPVLHWRRIDVVGFGADGPLGDVSLQFPRRKQIAEVLRARGYSVTSR